MGFNSLLYALCSDFVVCARVLSDFVGFVCDFYVIRMGFKRFCMPPV